MDKVIMKYNPAFLKAEELVASFVVRQGELETIIRIIKENVTKSNQHILVVGPRGIGKTTLLLRAVEEVRRTKNLNDKWFPLVFSEESYSVTTCGEFWLESMFHLAHQTKDEQWQKTYEELKDETNEKHLRERTLGQLMDFADKQGRRILLVVENLNMLLGNQLSDEDAWALRHTLLNEPRIMLLASATSRFEQIDTEGKPMFELFRFLELKPLNGEECRALWVSITGNKADDARVRPLEILTGGNPRLMAIVSNFAMKMSLKNLMNDLMQLVDEHTEYFKSHLDNLPAVERKVYLALAEIWDPATARQVGASARLNVSKTSSLLARLIARGAVVEANGKGKTKLYQVAERMYNIYYLMRKRSEASRRVKAIVNFMTSFYGAEELVGVAKGIAEEACQLASLDRGDHYKIYGSILGEISNIPLAQKIVKSTPRAFFEAPDAPASLKRLCELFDNIEQRQILSKRVIDVLNKDESLRKRPEKLEKEEKYIRAFVNDHPKDRVGWVALGAFLCIYGNRFEGAEKAFREAIQIDSKQSYVWMLLGILLEYQGRYQEAEQAYLNVANLLPNVARGWEHLGKLYHCHLKRFEEAERAYRKVIELAPKTRDAWNNLGLALEGSKKFKEAEKAFRKAIQLEKEPADALNNLGRLLVSQGRFEEGEKYLRESLKLEPNSYKTAGFLAWLLIENDSRRKEGWEILKGLVSNTEIAKKDVGFATEFFVTIAAAGYGQEALDILKESQWADRLEPVVAALRLMAGEDVKAAAEIMEVAKDVVKRIEETRQKIQSAKKNEVKK